MRKLLIRYPMTKQSLIRRLGVGFCVGDGLALVSQWIQHRNLVSLLLSATSRSISGGIPKGISAGSLISILAGNSRGISIGILEGWMHDRNLGRSQMNRSNFKVTLIWNSDSLHTLMQMCFRTYFKQWNCLYFIRHMAFWGVTSQWLAERYKNRGDSNIKDLCPFHVLKELSMFH